MLLKKNIIFQHAQREAKRSSLSLSLHMRLGVFLLLSRWDASDRARKQNTIARYKDAHRYISSIFCTQAL